MTKFLCALSLAVLLGSCGPKKTESTAVANQLTEQQKADGWQSLFDGQSMNGWRPFKNKESNSWEVVGGTLHCKANSDSVELMRNDLVTNGSYQNFELTFDWKISQKGNSGVIYRATEEFEVPYASGPEYQVLDDDGYPGDVKDVEKSGGCFAMYAPSEKKANVPGEWNSGRLVVSGNHVEHWLNGSRVADYELGSDEWKQRVNTSKWKDYPGYGLAPSGLIDLQDHGHEVWYRNIYIKVL
jgi:hypothetical protein